MIAEITKDEIRNFCKSKDLVARIKDIRFNIDKTNNECISIFGKHPPIGKDGNATYKSLGLQYVSEDDPYYDCVKSTRYINSDHVSMIESQSFSDWHKWNEYGEKLFYLAKPIYDLGLKLYRTRILYAEKNYRSVTHIDYDWRYHIPIRTNSNSYIEYQTEKFHLPADGHAYLVNAGFLHNFYNCGDTTRYHYCGILSLPNEGDGKFEECLKRGNKQKLDYVYSE